METEAEMVVHIAQDHKTNFFWDVVRSNILLRNAGYNGVCTVVVRMETATCMCPGECSDCETWQFVLQQTYPAWK